MPKLPSDTHSQRLRLLAYLRKHSSADTLTIRKQLDIVAPSSRVADLRARGYQIDTELIDIGHHPRIAHYTLRQEPT